MKALLLLSTLLFTMRAFANSSQIKREASEVETLITENLLKMFSPSKLLKTKEGVYKVSGHTSAKPNIECTLTFGIQTVLNKDLYVITVESEDDDFLGRRSIDHRIEINNYETKGLFYINSIPNRFSYALKVKDTFNYSINSNFINISNTKYRTAYKAGILSDKYSRRFSDENLNSMKIENQGNYVSIAQNYGQKKFDKNGKLESSWVETPNEKCLFDAK